MLIIISLYGYSKNRTTLKETSTIRTTDAIFIMPQVQERHQERERKLYYVFVDLDKAFDRVPWEMARWTLRKLGLDEWLTRIVMALYTEDCTIVRTNAGLSESLEVKVGLHQGTVLSSLLFSVVMNVVSSEARSRLPSELLYADDLVRIAPTMEQFGRRVTEWKASIPDKGLNVNAGKSKVMVGSSGEKMVVNSEKWPCGVRDDLSLVADRFRCKQCDGDNPRS